ncbi:DEAD/DEAH box helicase [Helcobacillus massiliensis]|uniref:DEAD/DEAH box helicase n=1 Tax=Helcobacillus massiliensis TaxID=521392 RepID=UPI002554A7F4|nr:DEAD/DEAH box helicase [Helcobacillus massiliensis]MDK7742016.1 DEAD/DEAH box helicase [Helcobacillus massiliensis]WOO93075.1 DEAD/DEAH box helicase [Helcobacillus massiliensis]
MTTAAQLVERITGPIDRAESLLRLERMPGRAAQHAPWPRWIDPRLVLALQDRGVREPYTHQVEAAEFARAGRHCVIATSTASGKSLAYLMPVLTALAAPRSEAKRATALYIAPTKALAQDQLHSVRTLARDAGMPEVRAATFDGDTPSEERRWIRSHANLILTNPDMLHFGILPGHEHWVHTLRALRYIIIDECHVYRGVFGAHTAMVMRRLQRIARHYGANPTFILASATSAAPSASASRLTGESVTAVTADGSPHAGRTIAFWQPPADASPPAEAGGLLADLVDAGAQTLVFTRARRSSELVARTAQRILESRRPDAGRVVAAYRGGYLPEERRALEQRLRSGDLRGLASTNALELGIDIAGLDAVVVTGWPGTRASLFQQFGRVGRSSASGADGGLALFVARDDPLDQYVVTHPDTILDQDVEAAVFDPENPYVLSPHLAAAASELPIRDGEEHVFGPTARELLDELAARRVLRRRASGWFWTLDANAHDLTDLRGSGGEPVRIVDSETGQLIGTVDGGSAHTHVHDGAVYLHQGVSFVVDRLDADANVAMVHREAPPHTTHPQSQTSLTIRQVRDSVRWGEVQVCTGRVDVTSQVTGYQVRDIYTSAVIANRNLDLPPRTLQTAAVWFEIPSALTEAAGIEAADLPGALHAAEHAQISLLPLLATCDRWDLGGLSSAHHPDVGGPAIFVYDGAPGGAGFAERGYATAQSWLSATADLIESCRCADGCPACVVSPKCGNGNEPLSKAGAVRLLRALLDRVPSD